MHYYSDPTANQALGPINREFSRLEKMAKQLHKLYLAGKLSPAMLEKERAQFKGIYKHVLDNVFAGK